MAEILLIRHAEAFANKRDFTAFGNEDSPLTERGIGQARGLNGILRTEYDIVPEEYDRPVLASTYVRPQQTAREAGFRRDLIDTDPLINESDFEDASLSGRDVIAKHQAELWVPNNVKQRANEFIDKVHDGELGYEIYFTHGMFIAAVLLECDVRLIETTAPFDPKRGYVPLQASITKLDI
jgi:broad specificity phosphatase PhoE